MDFQGTVLIPVCEEKCLKFIPTTPFSLFGLQPFLKIVQYTFVKVFKDKNLTKINASL